MTKRIIPNTITSLNLLCGSIAVFLATQNAFLWAFVFILAGAFFDFFDGLSARLLKAPSPIGIQLDSLADDITFGLAPAMMLFCWLRLSVNMIRLSVWQLLRMRSSGAVYAVCRFR